MKTFDSPAIVGSMFYEGDDLILDAAEGQIDESKVVERIDKIQKLSAEYGVPFIIDLEIPSIKSASNIIGLVGKSTDASLWISSFNSRRAR